MEALFETKDLTVSFNTPNGVADAVCGISIEVAAGECLAIVGESGSGKSQTFLAALGLSAKSAIVTGQACYNGVSLLARAPKALNAIRGREIAMIFQNPQTSLTPHLTVLTQLAETMQAHGTPSKGEVYARAVKALADVSIPEPERMLRQYPFELSGGMVQRVMIAIASLNNPKLIIADEPTTALDVTVQAEILSLLRAQIDTRGAGLVFITHDMAVVAQIADRVAVMYSGRIVETGKTRDILDRPRHPYTNALINAAPRLSGPVPDYLDAISGVPAIAYEPSTWLQFFAPLPQRDSTLPHNAAGPSAARRDAQICLSSPVGDLATMMSERFFPSATGSA